MLKETPFAYLVRKSKERCSCLENVDRESLCTSCMSKYFLNDVENTLKKASEKIKKGEKNEL